MQYHNVVDVPTIVHQIMKKCLFILKTGEKVKKEPKEDLFD